MRPFQTHSADFELINFEYSNSSQNIIYVVGERAENVLGFICVLTRAHGIHNRRGGVDFRPQDMCRWASTRSKLRRIERYWVEGACTLAVTIIGYCHLYKPLMLLKTSLNFRKQIIAREQSQLRTLSLLGQYL